MLRSRVCAAGRELFTGRDLPPDSPKKGGHLPSDCRHDDGQLFTRGAEAAIASAQTDLRLPGDVAHGLGQPFEPRSQGLADPRRITIGPGRLDERPPRAPVACQRKTHPSDCIAGRTLRGTKSRGRTSAVAACRTAARRQSRRRRSRRRETKRRAWLDKLPPPAPWTTPARRGRVASPNAAQALKSIPHRVDSFLKRQSDASELRASYTLRCALCDLAA